MRHNCGKLRHHQYDRLEDKLRANLLLAAGSAGRYNATLKQEGHDCAWIGDGQPG
jgi:hypothetical protein